MNHQKALFDLDKNITYLNGAYMSPQLKSVEEIGIACVKKKSEPYTIKDADFFSQQRVVKQRFATLISASDPDSIAIIPSVSYGLANAMNNIPFEDGDEIVIVEEQFPSNYYLWKQLENTKNVTIKTVKAPPIGKNRGAIWNSHLLDAISLKTKCVSIPNIHWADGTKFDLKEVRAKTKLNNAYLIIDGTQSVGALPFSVEEIQPDALICGGYKWLLGPYSLGVAYYGERFYNGTPIENNWMNHRGSEDFTNLINYDPSFKPKSNRYDVGEASNFILIPMLAASLKQLIEWDPKNIQSYCKEITQSGIEKLKNAGFYIEDEQYRSSHLFGVYPPKNVDLAKLKERLQQQKIIVSFRGKAIRISPNVYNTEEDILKMANCCIN